jgi:hypothetical protein
MVATPAHAKPETLPMKAATANRRPPEHTKPTLAQLPITKAGSEKDLRCVRFWLG